MRKLVAAYCGAFFVSTAVVMAACSPVKSSSLAKPTAKPPVSVTDTQLEPVVVASDATTVAPTTVAPVPTTEAAPTPQPTQPPVAPTTPIVPATPAPTHVTQAPVRAAPAASGATSGFQACVALRESGNGSGSSNIYGFLQSTWSSLGLSGSPGSASRAQQDAAFAMLYAKDGKAPWSPYDGCR